MCWHSRTHKHISQLSIVIKRNPSSCVLQKQKYVDTLLSCHFGHWKDDLILNANRQNHVIKVGTKDIWKKCLWTLEAYLKKWKSFALIIMLFWLQFQLLYCTCCHFNLPNSNTQNQIYQSTKIKHHLITILNLSILRSILMINLVPKLSSMSVIRATTSTKEWIGNETCHISYF